jgi:prepilin-type processing-associated H-X9-DG protein
MPAPPANVLAAFGASARPEPLSGGQATAWRAGDVVLKSLDMSVEALGWQAEVLGSMACDDFRVAPPLRTRAGELVVDGWTAWPMLAGAHAPRWAEIVAVGERFHRALAGVGRPTAVLDARMDGDLSGNVLFADGRAPAVLDLSPYWRPMEYASAIVMVDAVLWYGAEVGLLSVVGDAQLLVRALLFRLLATPDPAAAVDGYRRAIGFADGLLDERG